MKHRVASPAAFSIWHPLMEVASHVVLLVFPRYQREDATDQSREIRK